MYFIVFAFFFRVSISLVTLKANTKQLILVLLQVHSHKWYCTDITWNEHKYEYIVFHMCVFVRSNINATHLLLLYKKMSYSSRLCCRQSLRDMIDWSMNGLQCNICIKGGGPWILRETIQSHYTPTHTHAHAWKLSIV